MARIRLKLIGPLQRHVIEVHDGHELYLGALVYRPASDAWELVDTDFGSEQRFDTLDDVRAFFEEQLP